MQRFETMDRGDGVRLALSRVAGAAPTLVWLGGFRSDMSGTKAEALSVWAEDAKQSYLRLDYSGHGQSGGRFEDGCIGDWLSDALAIVDAQTLGPLVLVGSSMGGWIALLMARARPQRVKGLILLAPAPDFTERLMWAGFPDDVRAEIMERGVWRQPSAYDPEPTPITRRLIEDGRTHLLLGAPIAFEGPARILLGSDDPDVPRWLVEELFGRLTSADKKLAIIEGGDHRLSRPADIELLLAEAGAMARRVGRISQD